MLFRKPMIRFRLARQGLSGALREEPYTTRIGDRPITLNHSPFNTDWLGELNLSPKTIVEFGSFDGGDALRMSQAFPQCRVITVEADPARYRVVKQNLEGSNVQVEHFAICEKDGPIEWFSATIDGSIDGQGSIYQHTDNYREMFPFVKQTTNPGTVTATRVDSLCDRLNITGIDLLHMDIEGAEHAALCSLGEMRPRLVFAEMCDDRYVDGPTVDDTHCLLLQLGYQIIIDLGSDRLYASEGTQAKRRRVA